MTDKNEFREFPKMARMSREVVISEKIDGTNAQVFVGDDGSVMAGSRTRWIFPDDDNFGFASWVWRNTDELRTLGPGAHFGEWWGKGIQRGYGLPDKRFSLFNVERWGETRPACCGIVPVIWRGMFSTGAVEDALARLRDGGSLAAPGFMNPEGVVIWHMQGNFGLKKTLQKDEMPKALAAQVPA